MKIKLIEIMPIKKIFIDEHDNEMDCYLNDKRQAFIQIGTSDSDTHEKNFIVLDKSDVNELIKLLSEIEKDM